MAKEKPSIPKGTRDFGPQEVAKRKYILNTIEKVFIKYGFMPIETPTMENLSTLTGKYGDEGDKLLFKVLESGEYTFEVNENLIEKIGDFVIENDKLEVFKEIGTDFAKCVADFDKNLNNEKELFLKDFVLRELKSETFITHIKRPQYFFAIKTAFVNYLFSKGKNPKFKDFKNRFFYYLSIEEEQFKLAEIIKGFHYLITSNSNLNRIIKSDVLITKQLNPTTLSSIITKKGLRYDLTVPFARYVVMNRNEITFPFKRYQMQPVWRADRPQKGRYREFWQCDADVVGSDSLLHELDLTNIYLEVFNNLKIKVGVKINNRKILQGIADYFGCSERLIDFITILDKLDKIGYSGVINELKENNILNNKYDINDLAYFTEGLQQNYPSWTSQLDRLEKLFREVNSNIGIVGVEELRSILQNLPENESIGIFPNLARGLSYYTGTIWEVVVIDKNCSLRSSIGGGGRYDNLTGIFGLDGVSGVGISFGLDRIYDVLEELKLFPETLSQGSSKVLICASNSIENIELAPVLQLLSKLRNEGIASEIYTEKINVKKPLEKPIKYASSKKIPYAIIYTENETLKLKNLETGFQEELSIKEIIERLQN